MSIVFSIIGIIVICVIEGLLLRWWQKKNVIVGLKKESRLYLKLSQLYEARKKEVSDEYYQDYKGIVEAEDISAIEHAKYVIKKELGNTSIFGMIVAALQILVLAVGKLTSYSLVYSYNMATWEVNMDIFNARVDIVYQAMQIVILGYIIFAALIPVSKNTCKQTYFLCVIQDVLTTKKGEGKQNPDIERTSNRSMEVEECSKDILQLDNHVNLALKSSTPISEVHINVNH